MQKNEARKIAHQEQVAIIKTKAWTQHAAA